MTGFILAGGKGTRLHPLTGYINKTLLPVYDHPMIWYPYRTLKNSGIDEIYIVCQKKDVSSFANFFGEAVGYLVQDNPQGIASVFKTIQPYVKGDFVLILGDNIFEDKLDFKFFGLGKVFLKEVVDWQRFGVAEMGSSSYKKIAISKIHEKPALPYSSMAVTGCYVYAPEVIPEALKLQPSQRGEIEITDLNNVLAQGMSLDCDILEGYWKDAGTFDSLFEAGQWRKEELQRDMDNDCIL